MEWVESISFFNFVHLYCDSTSNGRSMRILTKHFLVSFISIRSWTHFQLQLPLTVYIHFSLKLSSLLSQLHSLLVPCNWSKQREVSFQFKLMTYQPWYACPAGRLKCQLSIFATSIQHEKNKAEAFRTARQIASVWPKYFPNYMKMAT